MSGPLSGIAGFTQVPLSNPYQPGQNSSQVKPQQDQQPQQNRIQPSGTQAAQTNNTDTNNQNTARSDQREISASSFNSQPGEQTRGSVLDISV